MKSETKIKFGISRASRAFSIDIDILSDDTKKCLNFFSSTLWASGRYLQKRIPNLTFLDSMLQSRLVSRKFRADNKRKVWSPRNLYNAN